MTLNLPNKRYQLQIIILLFSLLFLMIGLFWINNKLNNINDQIQSVDKEKEMSALLIDELRQSSDDLTNMARLYVVTGEKKFKEYFYKIVDIREGNAPRPIDYQEVYWDFVLADESSPRLDSEPKALVDLIDQKSSSQEAKVHFIKAKNNSDDLVLLEEEAFNAMEGIFKDSYGNYSIIDQPDQSYAIEILNSDRYFTAKAKIMGSIQDFSHFMFDFVNGNKESLIIEKLTFVNIQKTLVISIICVLFLIAMISLFQFTRARSDKKFNKTTTIRQLWAEIVNSWLVIFIGFIFSVLFIIYLNYTNKSIEEDTRKTLESSLATVMESTAEGLYNWLEHINYDVDKFIERTQFNDIIVEKGVGSYDVSNLIEEEFNLDSYGGYILFNREGIILNSNNDRWKGIDLTEIVGSIDLEEIIQRGNKAYFRFPQTTNANKQYSKLIKCIRNVNDQITFVLLLNHDSYFSKSLQLGRIGESGESYAFNKDGYMISESRFIEQLVEQGFLKDGQSSELNIILKDPVSNKFTLMASTATKGYSGVDIDGYNDYRGEKVIGSWTWSKKYGFGITTEIDFNEAYASFLIVKKSNWYTSGLFVLIMMIMIIIFIIVRLKLSKLQSSIKISEKKFRSITQTANDAIISTDKYGLIESWNPSAEEIFGYTEEEALKQPVDIIIPPKYKKQHLEGMKRVLSGGEKRVIGKVVELVGLRKDQSVFPMEMSLSEWESDNGVSFSAIIRDITERKRVEALITEAKERMENELNIAKNIQMSMLPLTFPAFPNRKEFDVFAFLKPAREVGGDFYDFYFIEENRFCFVVGDVTGKGVPAALEMAVTKTLISARAANDLSTASILTHVNNEIAQNNPNNMFITVFLGILNMSNGEVVYTNAGHNPPYIQRKTGEIERLNKIHGPVIGALEGLSYSEETINVKNGDVLFLYTDGITEAQNLERELYGEKRLVEVLVDQQGLSLETIVKELVKSVDEFEGEAEQADDITTLAIKITENLKDIEIKKLNITIQNYKEQIRDLQDKFEVFANENDFNSDISKKIKIVFDELAANIISYGYIDDQVHDIEFKIKLQNEKLIITIIDDGIPFNPFNSDPPDTKLSVNDRLIGGLGIHLVKNLMDEYYYKRSIGKNVVTLVKYRIKE